MIKSWLPEDQPREKLMQKGPWILSEAELIAILIGSGTSTISAVDVAKNLLRDSNNDLQLLSRYTVRDMMKIRGIGKARAVAIIAALELGRRRRESTPAPKPKINASRDAFVLLQGELMDLPHEEFWVLLLNRANCVIRKKRVSEGGVSGTVADPKIIFKMAIDELASGVIVVHNHPSGNLTASQSDIDLTRKLREAGRFLEVQLLDHLIVAGQKYYSFADEGMM